VAERSNATPDHRTGGGRERPAARRITVDDVVDVIREEADREILNLAGLREEEDLFASVWQSVRNRWTWLALNLVTALIARVLSACSNPRSRSSWHWPRSCDRGRIGGNSGNQTIP